MNLAHIETSLNAPLLADPPYYLQEFVRSNLQFCRQVVAELLTFFFALLPQREQKAIDHPQFPMKSISNKVPFTQFPLRMRKTSSRFNHGHGYLLI